MTRRKWLRLAGRLGMAGTLAGLYTWRIEPYWVEFVERDLPIANLPGSLWGKTLIQLSDLHVGNRFDYHYLIEAMQTARDYRPEIVVYTGDYVSYETSEQVDQLREVMAHALLGSRATLAVLGNHDYGKNWREAGVDEQIVHVLEQSGVEVLRNEARSVEGLNVIGLDDLWGSNFHPAEATSFYRRGQANLALCHNPDVCDMDVWNGYRGWILSGHTHGGQCKPPFLPPPLLPVENRRYTSGEFALGDGRRLYINRALGCSYPVRFNVRPEVTVFKMVPEKQA